MKIKTFGKIVEVIPNDTEINLKFNTVGEFKSYLEQNYPMLLSIPFVIAVDKKISSLDVPIFENTEIALLPPFSGG